jgi:hypothetical protein
LAAADVPMPGTIVSLKGIPEPVKMTSGASSMLFPNTLIMKSMLDDIRALERRGNIDGNMSLENVKALIGPAIKSVNNARNRKFANILTLPLIVNGRRVKANLVPKSARIAVRRMMSRYYGNSSPFALDLVGAVIRQGSFTFGTPLPPA